MPHHLLCCTNCITTEYVEKCIIQAVPPTAVLKIHSQYNSKILHNSFKTMKKAPKNLNTYILTFKKSSYYWKTALHKF